jgi:hypothetical protein
MTELEPLMERLAEAGATMIVKLDHERYAEGSRPWTVVISGPALGEGGYVRTEQATLSRCVTTALKALRTRGEEWQWVTSHETDA